MLADDYKDGKAGQETVGGGGCPADCSRQMLWRIKLRRSRLSLFLAWADSSFKPAGKSQSALFALRRHFILFPVLVKNIHLGMYVGAFFMKCYSEIPNKERW